MKKLLGLLIIIISVSSVYADEPTEVKSKIELVTVFLDGAEILNTAEIKLLPGQKEYVFTGLSTKMFPNTVNITATGDVSIVSIVERINYLDEMEPDAKIKKLQDSLELITFKNELITNEKNALLEAKNVLLKNQSLGGANVGVNTLELQKAYDFVLLKMKEIGDKWTDLTKKETKNREIYYRIKNQLMEMNAKINVAKSEVVVTFNAHSATTTDIKLRYLVSSAGWAPYYDLIVEDISKPIQLKYRAQVYNNTDVEWKDVKMKLSTADPLQGISKPFLETWYLNYDQDNYYGYNEGYYGMHKNLADYDGKVDKNEIAPSVMMVEDIPNMPQEQKIKDNQLYQAIEVSLVSTTFEIKTPYTIPSDGKPYLIDVKTEELPANYSYYSAPKIEESAYLLGRITGWQDLNLVEGNANIYFGDTYLGRSHIYTQDISDTLDLSLGRDEKIFVKREKLKDFSSKQFFGSTEKQTFTYEISVKNNRDIAIEFELQDQVPVSQLEEIVVEVDEISGASMDENTGILTWKMKLAAGEIRKVTLSFSIKHPKNKSIEIQQNKVRYSPKF